MKNIKLLNVGDKVRINPVFRSEFAGSFVKNKSGTIEEVETYYQFKYKVKYDKPYTYKGYTFKSEYYYPEEVIKL
jgi:hypothetical protein